MGTALQGLAQVTVNGLAMGAIYALVALSFVLVYKAVGVTNFATGDLVMLGGYVTVVLSQVLGLPLLIAVLGTIVVMGAFGYGFQLVGYYPLRGRPFIVVAISTLALAIIIANAVLVTVGPAPQKLGTLLPIATVTVGGVHIVVQHLVIIVATAITLVALQFLFTRTTIGNRMMATAQDPEMARLLAVNVDGMVGLTFVLATALAGIAGLLLAPVFYLVPTMGLLIAIKGFAASIIGGFGEVSGAIVGGLALGLAEIYLASYVSSAYRDVFVFLIMLGVLYVRPQGILGGRVGQKV